ncbi:alpha/beta fold hydrolase [Flavobacterium sp. GT3R68]|uniref:alpha/beta fold hydrolase n=1 Tax=Flavobacterium sp. GT3R68 TaxID=2594437 RepID=UPI000F8618FD|nr:alpha/beta hydrolase [Flavobacterium sp. GT3R68]RTY95311.1 alpha/beta hydrolase [Flavobacterium sp. GSN2]TRW90948.1 alpha/beta hydrolase [Flavobacterium sp. GT3R68]
MTRKGFKFRCKIKYILFGVLFSYVIFCQSCMMMRTSPKKTKKFFDKAQIGFVDKKIIVDGHKLHYVQTGTENKPTLVFIHGSPGSWDAYKNYLIDTLLLQKYRMISIDRPGFGNSEFGEAQDLKTQSRLLVGFLKTIDNKQSIALVGHSMGGPLIVKMATEEPSKYKHLIILAGSIDPNAEKPEKWRYVIQMKPIRYLIPGAMRPANDELWWLKQDLVDMEPFLKNITCDVTIIHGTKDRLVPYSNVAFMKRVFVNAKSIDIISIQDADHFIPWSDFETIRKALLELKL